MQIPKEKFSELLLSGDYTLIDVRTANEQVQYGVIDSNQTHIDISLPTATTLISNLNRQDKYLVYCWHGVRSQQVVSYMTDLGCNDVFDLEGGIDKWNKTRLWS